VKRGDRRAPLLAALAAAAVAAMTVVLVGGAAPLGGTLSEDDRVALDAPPVQRGAPPTPVHPSVDLTDPEAVARAYLAAAHSVTPADTGRTHRRAAGYAAPDTAPGAVGEVVLDPPPPGALRTAAATALELVAVDHDDMRRGYRAEVGTATGPPGGEVVVELVTRYVVLARQADGRWLVATDSPAIPDLPSGEH
jgi:hypothetical protein